MDAFNKNLQNCKNECVEFLVNEETKEPQSFRHFKNENLNMLNNNQQLSLPNQSNYQNKNNPQPLLQHKNPNE